MSTISGPLFTCSCALLQLTCALGHITAQGQRSFASFVEEHGKSYSQGTAEYEERGRLYHRNLEAVEEHNSNPSRLWDAGINRLSDWSQLELGMLRNWGGAATKGGGPAARPRRGGGVFLSQVKKVARLPEHYNWTHLSAAPRSIDQGGCGSCWAIASAAVLEMHTEIHRKEKRTFSAQELVACVPNAHGCGGTGGCDGSTVELAMDYVVARGLDNAESSPLSMVQSTAGLSGLCKRNGKAAALVEKAQQVFKLGNKAKETDLLATNEIALITAPGQHEARPSQPGYSNLGMSGWERLPENMQEPVMRAIVERGPVAVTVAAEAWQMYNNGIFDGCPKDAVVDHAVVMIGYGVEGPRKYWTIHNSWGNGWGEKGNMRLIRFDDDQPYCGVDRKPEQGTICKGGPKQVTVCGMCGILYDTVVPHFVHEV